MTLGSPHTKSVVGGKVVEKVGNKVVSEKDLTHVLAGYKATISSGQTSEEAKEHARACILELESSEHHHKDPKHVIAGIKAAIHNEHVHDEVKKDLRARLEEMGEHVE